MSMIVEGAEAAEVSTIEELNAFQEAVYDEVKGTLEPYIQPHIEAGVAPIALQGALLTFEVRPEDENIAWVDLDFRITEPSADGFHFDWRKILRPGEPEPAAPSPVISVAVQEGSRTFGVFMVLPQFIRVAQDVLIYSPEKYAELNNGGQELLDWEIASAARSLARIQAGVRLLDEPTTHFTGLKLRKIIPAQQS